jgi:hypothetical protein
MRVIVREAAYSDLDRVYQWIAKPPLSTGFAPDILEL